MPSPLFPAFVTAFLKKLRKHFSEKMKDPCIKQHYLRVNVHCAAKIHVIEQDSFIEIGLQQFHVGTKHLTEDQLLQNLQQSCCDVYSIVHSSAVDATACLGLDTSSLQYGCLSHCDNAGAQDCFGEFNQKVGILTCSCCDDPLDPTPQQQIWFSMVDHHQVSCVLCTKSVIVMVSNFNYLNKCS